jgi:hypothetical protein
LLRGARHRARVRANRNDGNIYLADGSPLTEPIWLMRDAAGIAISNQAAAGSLKFGAY